MDGTAVKLAPSILDGDFARLGDQVVEAEQAGADRIHVNHREDETEAAEQSALQRSQRCSSE